VGVSRLFGSGVCAKFFKYGFQHCIRIGEHFVVPKSHHAKPWTLKKSRPFPIRIRVLHVLAAIKFYDQAMVYTAEVHDVWTYGILAPELGGGEFPTPYPHPKMAFRIRLTPAQIARKAGQ
jgi:hypothetical protein